MSPINLILFLFFNLIESKNNKNVLSYINKIKIKKKTVFYCRYDTRGCNCKRKWYIPKTRVKKRYEHESEIEYRCCECKRSTKENKKYKRFLIKGKTLKESANNFTKNRKKKRNEKINLLSCCYENEDVRNRKNEKIPNLNSKSNHYKLVLDLDHTLVHSKVKLDPDNIDRNEYIYEVTVRPGVDDFLNNIKELGWPTVVYTAGTDSYAKQILDRIDPDNVISKIYHREHCEPKWNHYAKDLKNIDENHYNLIVLDDKHVYKDQQNEQVFKIPPFFTCNYGDDSELEKVLKSLKYINKENGNFRKIIKDYNNSNKKAICY
ncbi:PSR2 [Hepatospora eriocheir]|uniref:Mitochondrial import inner membrane translocase subunit TIM50 n=1 Tax=Hepatospora eriocheir TaxID=1081669 RepID=A0A1X0QCG3_9MICR|nr:PSR2 [Hepatospora eriocheir]